MSRATLYLGDSLEVTRTLPENSVDLILTSPPFLALRSYLPPDHPDKDKEIGGEPTPAAFIDTLLTLVAEWDRVLAPHGSICVELGDTYSGSGGSGGDYGPNGLRAGQAADWSQRQNKGKEIQAEPGPDDRWGPRLTNGGDGWPLAKSLCLIPELFRVALVYGINPLTGTESPAGRWRARNVVRWFRPNPPVGALGDKFRPATTEMVVICRSDKRFFDLDGVRTPHTEPGAIKTHSVGQHNPAKAANGLINQATIEQNPNGAPPLDTWIIPTQPYKGSHYATFPQELCVKPIKSMCPESVCITCGEPRRRLTKVMNSTGKAMVKNRSMAERKDGPTKSTEHPDLSIVETLGWSDCACPHDNDCLSLSSDETVREAVGCRSAECSKYRPGVVFDPFAGSGTTLQVATGHGRDAIGIDLDERNEELVRERVGMFLDVVDTRTAEGVA